MLPYSEPPGAVRCNDEARSSPRPPLPVAGGTCDDAPAMLARYRIRRGQPLAALPPAVRRGRREDTRKHTRHVLRPDAAAVRAYLAGPAAEGAWRRFASGYRALLAARFATDRAAFDELAERARAGDVFLGCSCPTAANPDVRRCHTVLALRFLAERYPDLDVRLP